MNHREQFKANRQAQQARDEETKLERAERDAISRAVFKTVCNRLTLEDDPSRRALAEGIVELRRLLIDAGKAIDFRADDKFESMALECVQSAEDGTDAVFDILSEVAECDGSDQVKICNAIGNAGNWMYYGKPEPEITRTIEAKTPGSGKLAPRIETHYRAYEYAADNMEGKPTDKQVYEWLKENGPDGYKLPYIDTWERYVRQGREHYGTQKNEHRAGRTGRSIVEVSDIMSRTDDENN